MSQQDDQDDAMRAEYHRDMCDIQKATIEAIKASTQRALTKDEAMLVAWSAGVSSDVFKELRK